MLTYLRIENFLLIEEALLTCHEGFTVITGETGSGKTILTQALRCLAGEKMSSDLIGPHSDKIILEAIFTPRNRTAIVSLLLHSGIEWENDGSLIIKREMHRSGKGRIFINSQLATLSLLQKLGTLLIEFTGQDAAHLLRQSGEQRKLLDLFGDMNPLLEETKKAIADFKKINSDLSVLAQEGKTKEIALHKIQEELQEIESAHIEEEEEITKEHNLLSHAQELIDKIAQSLRIIDESPYSLIVQHKKLEQILHSIASIDSLFAKQTEVLKAMTLELYEIEAFLHTYTSEIDINPTRFRYLEERLAIIDKLKRKYGDLAAHKKFLQKKEEEYLSYEERLDTLTKEKIALEQKAIALSEARFQKRTAAALLLSNEVTSYLRNLNMPSSLFSIDVAYSLTDDVVTFFLQPTTNQPNSKVQECASGGELSRLMLAIQSALGQKHEVETTIFDEIDANIGGATATIVGKTFAMFGKNRQIFAITHFPQVAKCANHHLQIHKITTATSTSTTLSYLAIEEKAEELDRMLGKELSLHPT